MAVMTAEMLYKRIINYCKLYGSLCAQKRMVLHFQSPGVAY